MPHVRALLVLLPLAAGCAHSARPAAPAAPAVRHTHENLNAVLWMQTAAEYRASALQAYRAARTALDGALADPRWTAALEQTGDPSALPPAVVLDLDETVLDNSAFQARDVAGARAFSPDAWRAWCHEQREAAVPGAVAFLQYAASRGVTPVFITNRTADLEADTRSTLARLGVPLSPARDTVLTQGEKGWQAADKTARRRAVAREYRILLLVGDDLGDFLEGAHGSVAERAAIVARYADRWGERWIVLPNPTYGSWEKAVLGGRADLPDAQALAAKYRVLRQD